MKYQWALPHLAISGPGMCECPCSRGLCTAGVFDPEGARGGAPDRPAQMIRTGLANGSSARPWRCTVPVQRSQSR